MTSSPTRLTRRRASPPAPGCWPPTLPPGVSAAAPGYAAAPTSADSTLSGADQPGSTRISPIRFWESSTFLISSGVSRPARPGSRPASCTPGRHPVCPASSMMSIFSSQSSSTKMKTSLMAFDLPVGGQDDVPVGVADLRVDLVQGRDRCPMGHHGAVAQVRAVRSAGRTGWCRRRRWSGAGWKRMR